MDYQNQNSQQTLREGLEEYYATFPCLDRFEQKDDRIIAKAFRVHDAIHVITGMNISPESEVILDTWQFWATYPGKNFWDSWRVTKETFTDPEFSSRLKSIIMASSFKDWFKWTWKCFLPCCRAIASSLKMNKKWPSYEFQQYLDLPLSAIRQEYNIKVMQHYC